MSRSKPRNLRQSGDKEERSSSATQGRRSILSILPSPASIQKPERARSRNRSVTRNLVSNKDIVDRADDTNGMDVENQENIDSLQRKQQQISINRSEVLRTNYNDNHPERNDDDGGVDESHSLPATFYDNIWTFFTHVNDDIYQCNLCSKKYKAYNRVDANLRKHIGKTHKMEDYLFESQKSNRRVRKQAISTDLKKKLHNAAIDCIIKDGRPFGDFRREGMKQFLSIAIPGYLGPHRNTVAQRLRQLYIQHRKDLKHILMQLNDISLTTDIWKNSCHRHFIVLTAHFHDKECKYTSIVIGFRQFIGPHDAAQIEKYISYEIDRLRIRYKLRSITTDNEPNIKKATQNGDFGVRISCYCHNINLIISNGLFLWEKRGKLRKMWLNTTTTTTSETNTPSSTNEEEEQSLSDSEADKSEDGMIYSDLAETNNSSDGDETSDGDEVLEGEAFNEDSSDEENFIFQEKEQQQTYEVLNDLVNEQIFEDTITNTTPPAKIIFGVHLLLCRVRCLIICIRNSHLTNDYVRSQAKADKTIKGGELALDFHVRWSTTCIMLTKFIAHRRIITDITNTPSKVKNLKKNQCDRLMSLTLRPQHWEWLICLKNILDPFHNATKALSGRNYETIAQGNVALFALTNFLSKEKTNHHLENIFKRQLFQKYHLYFENKISNEQKRLTLVAAFLTPYSKQYLNEAEIRTAESVLIQEYGQITKCQRYASPTPSINEIGSSNNAQQSIKSPSCHSGKSMDHLLKICLVEKPPVHKNTNKTMQWTIQQELGYYITTGTPQHDFQSYWKSNQRTLPILSSLARRFCLSPATSVASESSFSCANYVQRKQRSSLSAANLCYTMILRERDLIKRLCEMY